MGRSCNDQFSVSHRHLRQRTRSFSHSWPPLSTTHLMIERAWNKRKCADQVLASRKKPPEARHRLRDRITSSSTRVAFNTRSDSHLLGGRQRLPVSRHLHADRRGCRNRLGRPSRADVWMATPTPKKHTEQTRERYAKWQRGNRGNRGNWVSPPRILYVEVSTFTTSHRHRTQHSCRRAAKWQGAYTYSVRLGIG